MAYTYPGEFLFKHYGRYLRKKFGQPVYKIMVDGGFTCPNRDGTVGTGGCMYCNNEAFSAGIVGVGRPVSFQVLEALREKGKRKKYRNAKFLVYFQKYSNTYGDIGYLERVYREALVSEMIAGIVIGTRPDCIDEEIVSLLKVLSVETHVSVELGVQTISDAVLLSVNRGHSYEHFLGAARLLREGGIEFGVHMIYGLPGDTRENFLEGAMKISREGSSLVKLNHIRVVRDTGLQKAWEEGKFSPPSYDEYLYAVCDFLELLSPEISVARLISSTPEKYLLAPKWSRGSSGFIQDVNEELRKRGTFQGFRRET